VRPVCRGFVDELIDAHLKALGAPLLISGRL
jgi:hypothetical protein